MMVIVPHRSVGAKYGDSIKWLGDNHLNSNGKHDFSPLHHFGRYVAKMLIRGGWAQVCRRSPQEGSLSAYIRELYAAVEARPAHPATSGTPSHQYPRRPGADTGCPADRPTGRPRVHHVQGKTRKRSAGSAGDDREAVPALSKDLHA